MRGMERNVAYSAQVVTQSNVHIGSGVHGEHKMRRITVLSCHHPDRLTDALEGCAMILPAVDGHQNDSLAQQRQLLQMRSLNREWRGGDEPQRVDAGISGDMDGIGTKSFPNRVVLVESGGCEMQVRHYVDDLAINFFGKGLKLVLRSNSRLNVSYRDLRVASSHRARHR